MKKNRTNIILILIFFVGLSVMLYPVISEYWNARTQSKAVASYNDTVQKMTQADFDEMFKVARTYNEELAELSAPLEEYTSVKGYEDLLDVSGTGIMGYITIDKIRVELPIYHGTSDGVLQVAAGHLEGTSLPIGGKGTHSVLSAHRGLPSARLFTNLDELEEDDTFRITVLNRTMTYRVDQIRIVEPQEVEELAIDEAKDYVTLMTCTPYGINSHRMLVRGVRTTNEEIEDYVAADAHVVNTSIVALIIAIVLLLLLIAGLQIARVVQKRREKKE